MAENSIVIFGAGKIGRSFIGQLFGRAGYKVVFIDTEEHIVRELNRRKEYPVVIKGSSSEEKIIIKNVHAIPGGNEEQVAEEIRDAGILAISVGKKALPAVAPSLARGLLLREDSAPGRITDIILAENMRSAAAFFREQLRKNLPPEYPLEKQVGLVETSIGKMVPIMNEQDLREDPLQVFAEPYNTLILDRKGFRGKIPSIPELALKDHMKPWVDRKAFIHNLGHAATAYCGFLKHPGAKYMYEILDDPVVCDFSHRVMMQSAGVLLKAYPEEFNPEDLSDHIDDLLERFRNRNLGDTIFRVGCDLHRKLSEDDRFMGIIRLAQELEMPFGNILEAMCMGFHFRAGDEQGRLLPGDEEFHSEWKQNPGHLLEKVCGLNPIEDDLLIRKIMDLIHSLKKGLNSGHRHIRQRRSRYFLLWVVLSLAAETFLPGQGLEFTGRVIDKVSRSPVPDVTVYQNGTSNGTITDQKGRFRLSGITPPGDLILSHVSYEVDRIPMLDSSGLEDQLVELEPRIISLEEATVIGLSQRGEYLRRFKALFLGKDYETYNAEILNDSVLIFQVLENDQFTAGASEPLLISLPYTGYHVKTNLVNFQLLFDEELEVYHCSILGYYFFEPVEPSSRRRQRQLARNRVETYYNSSMHFCRSLYHDQLAENGYVIRSLCDTEYKDAPEYRSLQDFRTTYDEDAFGNRRMLLTDIDCRNYLISFYTSSRNRPVDLTYRNIGSSGVLKSGLRFLSDSVYLYPSGRIPGNLLLFSGSIGSKTVASMLPEDYIPAMR